MVDYTHYVAQLATAVTIATLAFCVLISGGIALFVGAFTDGRRLHPRSALHAVLGACLMAAIIWGVVFAVVY